VLITDGERDPSAEDVAEWSVEASADCPHCGEPVTLTLDPGGGTRQEYVEDCPVCCRPWRVQVRYGGDGSASVTLDPD
jgi:hypothetical protein